MKIGSKGRRPARRRVGSGASPAAELPLWSKLIPACPIPLEHLPFLRNKKSPPHGGTVLTPAEAKFRGGGAAPLLV